jgi:transcription elongation factor GreB
MPAGSKYITAEGAAALAEELEHLWRVRRPAVTRAVAEAAQQGDRSENAEYIYGKKQLAEIDRRVRHLRKRLDAIRIVDTVPDDTSRVFFGAWAELESAAGERTRVRIVGPDEIDLAVGHVSMDSPLGKALIGRRIDERILVRTPRGTAAYVLKAVEYKKKPG